MLPYSRSKISLSIKYRCTLSPTVLYSSRKEVTPKPLPVSMPRHSLMAASFHITNRTTSHNLLMVIWPTYHSVLHSFYSPSPATPCPNDNAQSTPKPQGSSLSLLNWPLPSVDLPFDPHTRYFPNRTKRNAWQLSPVLFPYPKTICSTNLSYAQHSSRKDVIWVVRCFGKF